MNNILPNEILKIIEDIVFDPKNLSSKEKIKLSLVSKEKLNLYTKDTYYNKIDKIYEKMKKTYCISIKDAYFINKLTNFIIKNAIDIYEDNNGNLILFDEYFNSTNYKDYQYKLTLYFSYNKLYTIYILLKNKIDNNGKYIFINENKKYQKNAIKIYNILDIYDIRCQFPNINNLNDYIDFIKELSMKQKIYIGK